MSKTALDARLRRLEDLRNPPQQFMGIDAPPRETREQWLDRVRRGLTYMRTENGWELISDPRRQPCA